MVFGASIIQSLLSPKNGRFERQLNPIYKSSEHLVSEICQKPMMMFESTAPILNYKS